MSTPPPSPTISGRAKLLVAAVLLTAAALIALVALPREAPPAPDDVIARATAFYESHPPYLRPRPFSEVPPGLQDLRAETCGACHQEIYREWQLSTHRRAWKDDLQFMQELAKSRGAYNKPGDPPSDVGWMCVNCHTPSMQQQEQLVVGLHDGDLARPIYADNPTFDPVMQDDAISCATCHVRDGVVYGPYGDTNAPHATKKDPNLLKADLCTSCHQATAMFPKQNLGCFFTTGEEHAASPQGQAGQSCQSCHMPEVTRPLVPGYPERVTRRHWFGGSLIPKKPEYGAELKALEPIYGSGASVEVRDATPDETQAACQDKPAPCRAIVARITNAHAGHGLPTGDPERHIEVEADLTAPDGAQLSSAETYIGDRYVWWPTIKRTEEARLMAGEHRDLTLTLPADQPATLRLKATKYRMHQEAFDYHKLEGQVVRGRTFHDSSWQLLPDAPPKQLSLVDDWHPEAPATP